MKDFDYFARVENYSQGQCNDELDRLELLELDIQAMSYDEIDWIEKAKLAVGARNLNLILSGPGWDNGF